MGNGPCRVTHPRKLDTVPLRAQLPEERLHTVDTVHAAAADWRAYPRHDLDTDRTVSAIRHKQRRTKPSTTYSDASEHHDDDNWELTLDDEDDPERSLVELLAVRITVHALMAKRAAILKLAPARSRRGLRPTLVRQPSRRDP